MKFGIEANSEFDGDIFLALNGLVQSSTAAASLAALHEAEYIFALSQAIVPVDTGELLLSGRVETETEEEGDFEDITVGIAYGGEAGAGKNQEDVDYALAVHENLEAYHAPPGEPKYLERPTFEEWASGRSVARMAAEMSASIAKAMVAFTGKKGFAIRGPGGRFLGSVKG